MLTNTAQRDVPSAISVNSKHYSRLFLYDQSVDFFPNLGAASWFLPHRVTVRLAVYPSAVSASAPRARLASPLSPTYVPSFPGCNLITTIPVLAVPVWVDAPTVTGPACGYLFPSPAPVRLRRFSSPLHKEMSVLMTTRPVQPFLPELSPTWRIWSVADGGNTLPRSRLSVKTRDYCKKQRYGDNTEKPVAITEAELTVARRISPQRRATDASDPIVPQWFWDELYFPRKDR